jgi:hypothetical protein
VQRFTLLAAALSLPVALTACGGGHAAASDHIHCGLVTGGDEGGKAVVRYDDTTGVPKMSAAIKAAVVDWNASNAPVVLQPSTQNPSLTFTAANDQPALPACKGTGGAHAVLYPTSDAEHAIGHALGLIPGGKCPALMALKACQDRATAPDAEQLTVLQKLYAPSSATPSPSSS